MTVNYNPPGAGGANPPTWHEADPDLVGRPDEGLSFLDHVPVLYRNWRGEVRVRPLAPSFSPDGILRWHKPDQYHGAGWRLRCHDAESDFRRDFAMPGILAWGIAAIAERQREQAAARTLESIGYSYTPGAGLWKPPIGQEPDFDGHDQRCQLAVRLRVIAEHAPGISPKVAGMIEEAAAALDAVPLVQRP